MKTIFYNRKLKLTKMATVLVGVLTLASFSEGAQNGAAARRVIDLNGTWKICNLPNETMPSEGDFNRTIPVPGLVDMAVPAFQDVGPNQWNLKRSKYKDTAFWYRRSFSIDGAVSPVAILKLSKLKFGCRAYLNGELVGSGQRNFTPHYFDVSKQLKGDGQPNELLICIGAHYTHKMSSNVPNGRDPEKVSYIPGIYDGVELQLMGELQLENIQVAPHLPTSTLQVQTTLINHTAETKHFYYTYILREAKSGKEVLRGTHLDGFKKGATVRNQADPRGPRIDNLRIKLDTPHLWTPDDPFLYTLEVTCLSQLPKEGEKKELYQASDTRTVRFGFRDFKMDPVSGMAVLNGKKVYLRGSNITFYRFFEDTAVRGSKPWDKEWARKVIRSFKDMHWNSVRYCISFPPEIWYEVADEEGLLVMDEYPIWYGGAAQEKQLSTDDYVRCFRAWMRERWNHPCVVVWDSQNETWNQGIANEVVERVRGEDLSDRPWDVGWEDPAKMTDTYEQHKYYFQGWAPKGLRPIEELTLEGMAKQLKGTTRGGKNVILNEYGWLWLNRDGSPTTLSKRFYDYRLPNGTPNQRRELYARYLAAITEVFRSSRELAGLLHFCGLGYSRPDGGATSDNYIELEGPTFEPYFYKYVRDAFAPVGLMLDIWEPEFSSNEKFEAPVVVINDEEAEWSGDLIVSVYSDGKKTSEEKSKLVIKGYGKERIVFSLKAPRRKGTCEIIAELTCHGHPVKTYRLGMVE